MLIAGLFKNVTKGNVARYMLMPQVMPRIREFYQSGFGHLAYIIALVYRAVNILPEGHPILSRENRANISIRSVLGAAGAELKFTRDTIDKTVIYFTILTGLVLLVVQFFTMLAYLMINPAMAQEMPKNYGEFFADPVYPDGKGGGDVAYNLLFSVFGIPDLFKPGGAPSEFHTALHSMFQFYSIGLLVVAVIIVCYFIFAVLVETAQTGVPFGKRYNHVWTPIRLVFALGLLIPIGYGLNAAQWITLYSAKFGSDFATKGWTIFNEKMTSDYLANPEERVGTPQAPDLMSLFGSIMVVHACDYAFENLYDHKKIISAYIIKDSQESGPGLPLGSADSFYEALAYSNFGDITIRFGEYDKEKHTKERGYVFPYCGEIVIRSGDTKQPGTLHIQNYYYELVVKLYTGQAYDISKTSEDILKKFIPDQYVRDENAPLPSPLYKSNTAKKLHEDVEKAIKEAVSKQADSEDWKKNQEKILKLGWGGAGTVYLNIAEINGSLVTATRNIPQVRLKPAVMEYVEQKQLQENQSMADLSGSLANNQEIQFDTPLDRSVARGLKEVYAYWNKEDLRQDANGNQVSKTQNPFIDTINLIFGTRGLFDMCASANVHPLAQLSTLGKGLMEASIRNLSLAFLAGIGGALPIPYIGAALGAASSILLSIASITITMGFMLFYVLPFMPFLYFFFAVGGWIKGLFEAMVGVPLWALAHLRIDGEGLPGDAAMDGIYLIFEIFVRPILIIFGFLASVIIFSAMVKVLNDIFSLVVVNLAGHDPNATTVCGKAPMGSATGGASGTTGGTSGGSASGGSTISYFRGPIDELFFTVMYAIIVYMIGMSCFKLIDLVPNNILRYMGSRVNSYNDSANDPAEGLMFRLSAATSMVSSKVVGGSDSIVGGATGVASNTFKAAQQFFSPPPQKPPGG